MIRQIGGDELDNAGSLHLFRGEATADEQALGSLYGSIYYTVLTLHYFFPCLVSFSH
jgi:hypothetical protein